MIQCVELVLDARGVVDAALLLVQLECVRPRRAGLRVLPEGCMGVAKSIEDVSFVVSLACFAAQGEGLTVMILGRAIVAGAVSQITQAVQDGCLALVVMVVTGHRQGRV